MKKDILFYSNFCTYSKEIINSISKTKLNNSIIYVCVDDNNIQLPPFIKAVPTIYLVNEKKIVVDENITTWLKNNLSQYQNANKHTTNSPPNNQGQGQQGQGHQGQGQQGQGQQGQGKHGQGQQGQGQQSQNQTNSDDLQPYFGTCDGSFGMCCSNIDDSNNVPYTSSFTFIGEEQNININKSNDTNKSNSNSNSKSSGFDKKLNDLHASRNSDFQPIQRS
jgi:hypothetical protein